MPILRPGILMQGDLTNPGSGGGGAAGTPMGLLLALTYAS